MNQKFPSVKETLLGQHAPLPLQFPSEVHVAPPPPPEQLEQLQLPVVIGHRPVGPRAVQLYEPLICWFS
jgi:hypothetical protein